MQVHIHVLVMWKPHYVACLKGTLEKDQKLAQAGMALLVGHCPMH